MIDFKQTRQKIADHIVDQRSRSDHAEVHTPAELIDEMLDKIPESEWNDPNKTWLDPCAGIGNFPLQIAERLMETLADHITDPEERYRHIVENQIFMIEIQPKNCIMIEKLLNPDGQLNLNLNCVDTLQLDVEGMQPADWKTERFRTDYGTQHTFFERTPSEEEIERLEQVRKLCENEPDWIFDQFKRGYENVLETVV